MSAYCQNNPIILFDPLGKECKSHSPWYVPNCFACNPFYKKYVNEHLDWYNKWSGDDPIDAVNFDGTVHYFEPISVDFNSTEFKVIGTIGLIFGCFELSVEAGMGFGCEFNIGGMIMKSTKQISISGYNGPDIGNYVGVDYSVWDIGIETASYTSNITGKIYPKVGFTKINLLSGQLYCILGIGASLDFNCQSFVEGFSKLWW